jgi:uncharacterized membrane protein (TIGR01666 family)
MDQISAYRNFLSGRYFTEGLRTTVGIITPSLLMSYSGNLPLGFLMSAGALCASITDMPGPVRYRVNGMLACIFFIVLNVILAGLLSDHYFLMGLLILVAGFFFSMLTVYGMRTSSIGIAALLVLVFSLDTRITHGTVWERAGMFGIGGLWYLVYSITLYRLRPYKIIQQVMGDYVLDIANYLRLRGGFYEEKETYTDLYQELLRQQVKIEQEQQLLNELIFKTRATLKDSNHTARVLLKMYLDATDIFESVMTTYHDYEKMHHFEEVKPLIEKFRTLIQLLSDEWVEIGVAIKTGSASVPAKQTEKQLQEIRTVFDDLRKKATDHELIEILISMGRILNNIEDLVIKTQSLHYHSTYDKKIQYVSTLNPDAEVYNVSKSIQPTLFINNLNFQSGIFRHALRVGLALLTGYIIAHLFSLGHGNWILLTILVIMKPAYSLTRDRNRARLFGTVIGLVIGAVMIYFIQNHHLLLILMICCMLGSFTFIKTNYQLAVIFMTPQLMILFSVLFPGNTQTLFTDRLMDTMIGSGIAALYSFFIFPAWEQRTIQSYMSNLIKLDYEYYTVAASSFTGGSPDEQTIRRLKRQSLIALANLGDAFNRMLSEPKQYRVDIETIHRFVVLSYSVTSHITTLLYLRKQQYVHPVFRSIGSVIENTNQHFEAVISGVEGKPVPDVSCQMVSANRAMVDELVQRRKEEIRRGELETPLKTEMITVKSVLDQFQYLQGLVIALARLYKK